MTRGNVENASFTTAQPLCFATSVTVSVLQLLVVSVNCCLVVVSMQGCFGETFLPKVLEWLQTLDGVETKMNQNMFRKQGLMNIITGNIFLPIMVMAEWCSVHYVECLGFLFISQTLVFTLAGRKWFSGAFLNCFLCFSFLLKSNFQRTQSFSLDVLLSCATCVISWYLLLSLSLSERLFGRNKKKKIKKAFELRTCTNDQMNSDVEPQENDARKLKLPVELEFAEENHNLDENISSLSLGPINCDGEKKFVTGSWFDNNLSSRSFQPNLSPDKPSLIWPAKFHLNGLALHSRKREHGMLEFSDDEGFLGSHMQKRKRRKNESRRKVHQNGDISRTRTRHWHCNVLCLILFTSLALNAWFIWLLKDTIRKQVFKT